MECCGHGPSHRMRACVGQGGDCVEVATGPSAVHVRDSKNTGPNLTVTPGTWAAFLGFARQDRHG
ncbi:DUF397 domain-containing protein [Streptomyces sp. NPDC050211]|uniref:DUF397 domain-containing protein n=1 Tax=Streptomyces sp. NPDC050211 TaxID=3154932 RepID=UPI0034335C85